MADPLITAMGTKAQQAIEKRGIDILDVEIDAEGNYVVTVPDSDIGTSGVGVIVKGQ